MKNLKNLGKSLSKIEQNEIHGGKQYAPNCSSDPDCNNGQEPICKLGYISKCIQGTCHILICN